MHLDSSPLWEWSSVNFGRHYLFSLSHYLETKMLNSLSHILVIWVFHSFSRRKVIAFLSTFSQTAVNNIYFVGYFICSLQTIIVIISSLFCPNQLSLWEVWIKDWIWNKWNTLTFFGRDTNKIKKFRYSRFS